MNYTKTFTILFICSIFLACQNVHSQKSVKENKEEFTSTQKAIKTAEEFIARNGYTKETADKENLSYESVEFESDITEMLENRFDTLEPKAYGYLTKGKDGKGWTVVFRYSENMRKELKEKELGRAVTMDENFEHLRVEHKDFILKFAQKLSK